MEYPKEPNVSIYDFSDKSIPHAGYAAITYAILSLFNGLLAWILYFAYHRPVGGFQDQEFLAQQYLQPLLTAEARVFSVIVAVISGTLAFGILRHSRIAVVAMLVFVIVLQLDAWFGAHSLAGTLVSIIVVGFLLRGARRIFQDHAERKLQAQKV